MADFEQQQLMERYVPQLVKLLLSSSEEDATYEQSLAFARSRLELYRSRMATAPEKVWNNLRAFINRFAVEQLQQLGDTIRVLANVIIDDEGIGEDLKWALLDFLLSVNFRAFRTAAVYPGIIARRRRRILWALGEAEEQERMHKGKVNKTKEQIQFDLASFRRALDYHLDCEALSHRNSPINISLGMETLHSALDASSSTTLKSSKSDMDANLNLTHALIQLHRSDRWDAKEEEELPHQTHYAHAKVLPSAGCFAACYGDYLQLKIRRMAQKEKEYSEECLFIFEALMMFFKPSDCRYFVLNNGLIELRPQAIIKDMYDKVVLGQVINPLQYMQLLHDYIDCFEATCSNGRDCLETVLCLTGGMRRLLKPVVESLTHYERNVNCGKFVANLSSFRHATRHPFKRLEHLWNLAAASYIKYPLQSGSPPYYRSQHIFSSLLDGLTTSPTAEMKERRSFMAALLVHVLQVHCRLLDNWWLLGDFNDSHDEFPAQRVGLEGHADFVMRPVDTKLPFQSNAIYEIIKRHIESAGTAVAVLNDYLRLDDFVDAHKSMLKKNLYQRIVKSVLLQLHHYAVKKKKSASKAAPDIFHQFKNTDNSHLCDIYYMYFKETKVDPQYPSYCSIDDLLLSCQGSAIYTPLDKIICFSLERQLEQRALLANTYVSHLLKDTLQLDKTLEHLRLIYLLLNFELFANQFEAVFINLQRGLSGQAASKLQDILKDHNAELGYRLQVELPSPDLKQLTIQYNCGNELSCIISEQQVKRYNEVFRTRLQLNLTVRKLQQLPMLSYYHEAIKLLLQMQQTLLISMGECFQTELLQQATNRCNENLQQCCTIAQLQQLHQQFVEAISTINRSKQDLQQLFTLAHILQALWRRVEYLSIYNATTSGMENYDNRYEGLNRRYLLTVSNSMKAMQCLHLNE